MAREDFFSVAGRERIAQAIRAVEAQTSAEVMVQVRRAAGRHRGADYLAGAALALAVLLVLLFAERRFSLLGVPVQTTLAFFLGAWLSSRIAPIQRLFVGRASAEVEVHRAARAAFVDLGVHRCSGRWGLLVLAALLERRVEVVADLGIDTEGLGHAYAEAVEAMQRAVSALDCEAFARSLEALGPVLARQHPHRDDDVDELSDEMVPEAMGDGARPRGA